MNFRDFCDFNPNLGYVHDLRDRLRNPEASLNSFLLEYEMHL